MIKTYGSFKFVSGGLTAVMWTDFIQTIIMIIGAVYLMIASESCYSIFFNKWVFNNQYYSADNMNEYEKH